MRRPALVVASALLVALPLAACSILTSLDGFAGGDEPDAADGAVGKDSSIASDGTSPEGAAPDGGDAGEAGPTRSALYASAVLADKPLGYWRFEETSGAKAKDETAGTDGIYTQGPLLAQPGVAGSRAIKLPKDANARVQVPSPAFHFPGNAPYSVEVWVRPGELKDYQFIASTELPFASGQRNGWSLLAGADGPPRIEVWAPVVDGGPTTSNQARGAYLTQTALTQESFHHVVATYDGTRVVGYLDGVRGTTQSAPNPAASAGALAWGCRPDPVYCLDDWLIDEAAVYDFALTPARVKAHFDLGK